MIVSRIRDGLGNQMFQYAMGKRLAIEHDTELKLDLSWYGNQDEVEGTYREYTLDNFGITASTASERERYGVIRFGRLGWRLANSSVLASRPKLTAYALNYYREFYDVPNGRDPR